MLDRLPITQQFLFDADTQTFDIRFPSIEVQAAKPDTNYLFFEEVPGQTSMEDVLAAQSFVYEADDSIGVRFTFQEPTVTRAEVRELAAEGYRPAQISEARWSELAGMWQHELIFQDKNRQVLRYNDRVWAMAERVISASVAFVVAEHAEGVISPIRITAMSLESLVAIQRSPLDEFIQTYSQAPQTTRDVLGQADIPFQGDFTSVVRFENGRLYLTLGHDCACFGNRYEDKLPEGIVVEAEDSIMLSPHNFTPRNVRTAAAIIGLVNRLVIDQST